MKTPSVGFGSDNHSGVHPLILKAIEEVNVGHQPSYGTDPITEQAVTRFREVFGTKELDVHFVFNGTAANVLALKSFLKSYQAILCAETSHLYMDECAAPEAWIGCKLIPLPTQHGKISIQDLEKHLIRLGDQHAAQPAAVSITQPTELGTVYSLKELRELRDFCTKNKLIFHIDGARLPNAVVSLKSSFKEMITGIQPDCVSFGGTKNGLLGAEAVLFFGPNRPKDFNFVRKQALQLPSKMRFLAAQFIRFFDEDLWLDIAEHSTLMAKRLELGLKSHKEVRVLHPVESNAVFVNLPREWVKPLRESFFFYVWDELTWDLRWMTTFDTQAQDVDNFLRRLSEVKKA